jgi:hypothetical protein
MTGVVEITTAQGSRQVSLSDYLDTAAEERAATDARHWIKALRQIPIDGRPLRSRFTVRGDSLWWFTELYLHKERAILGAFRAIAACDALLARERPSALRWVSGDPVTARALAAHAAARQVPLRGAREGPLTGWLRRTKRRLRARALHAAALRPARRTPAAVTMPIAAFVHRAFVVSHDGAAAGERYIGRVLDALERHGGAPVGLVAVGPQRNFRARRWWNAALPASGLDIPSVESFGPGTDAQAVAVWRARNANLAALLASPELRQHAVLHGADCWPIVRDQLEGVAWLQWPWSAWAMDQAGAALDAIRPGVCVTYAEAGGWGRALALECRRRGIPLAAIQHGFIYRHWLNYLHEPDEQAADLLNPADAGFPRPSLTLVFDEFAAAHLRAQGHFPPGSLRVAGSAERDDLARVAAELSDDARAAARTRAGVPPGAQLFLCATKFIEARAILPALAAAASTLDGVHLAIKAHPAETADLYAPFAGPAISVLPPEEPLLPLVAASRAVVTVNSTVAIDALAVGIPALTLGRSNNLAPFVEAGAMLAAGDQQGIAAALSRLAADDALRAALVERGRALLGPPPRGRAADACASAILALAGRPSRAAGHSA